MRKLILYLAIATLPVLASAQVYNTDTNMYMIGKGFFYGLNVDAYFSNLTVSGSSGIALPGSSTINGTTTSGTSKYNVLIDPIGSAAGFNGRVDGLHVGDESNCNNTSNAMVGAYISVGRDVGKNATATWPSESPDTGLRVVAVNDATNNATQYGLRGAYIKAKNYTTGTVKDLEGLFVEVVGDGTETDGEAIGIKLGTDSSTIDVGIDLTLAVVDQADIKLHHGSTLLDSAAGITVATPTFAIVTNATVGGTLGVTGPATFGTVTGTTVVVNDGLTVQTNATVGGTLGVTGPATFGTVTGTTVVVNDGLTVQTNATVGGTLGVTGVTTLGTVTGTTVVVNDGLTVQTNATVGGTLGVTGVTTLNGRGAVVGESATVMDLIQYGTVENFAGTTYTGTFSVAYGSGVVPNVFIQSLTVDGVTNAAVPVAVSNQFTYVTGAATSLNWMAIGAKP